MNCLFDTDDLCDNPCSPLGGNANYLLYCSLYRSKCGSRSIYRNLSPLLPCLRCSVSSLLVLVALSLADQCPAACPFFALSMAALPTGQCPACLYLLPCPWLPYQSPCACFPVSRCVSSLLVLVSLSLAVLSSPLVLAALSLAAQCPACLSLLPCC